MLITIFRNINIPVITIVRSPVKVVPSPGFVSIYLYKLHLHIPKEYVFLLNDELMSSILTLQSFKEMLKSLWSYVLLEIK